MTVELKNIEDCLEAFAGLVKAPKFIVLREDATIMYSIARQVFKGKALTDRQYELMRQKLLVYQDQFEDFEYTNFIEAIGKTRLPFRNIDRSKYIKLETTAEVYEDRVYESYKESWSWITVRFPFSKNLIVAIQDVVSSTLADHVHHKGTHKHSFVCTEHVVHKIVETFKDKNFEIEQSILDAYNELDTLEEKDHIPCIYNNKLINLPNDAVEILKDEIGDCNQETAYLYQDRSILYGLKFIDSYIDYKNCSVLTSKICNRVSSNLLIAPSKYNFNHVVTSLLELKRFPLVVFLDSKDPYKGLHFTYEHFKGVIDNKDISVQFRLPTSESNGFNEYIAKNNLNNSVDNNTKLVYTNIDKLNKPLLTSACRPRTLLLLESLRATSKVQAWIDEFDLVIHYDDYMSQFNRFTKQRITEI